MTRLGPAARKTIDSLAATLRRLGVQEQSSIDELLKFKAGGTPRAAPTAAYVIGESLRIQAHYDLEPAMLVYDPYLSTIGLVEIVTPESGSYRDDVERLIEGAVYLRQLALLDAERRRRPLSVELVLVVPDDRAAAVHEPCSTVLREIVRDTGYLESIGVSILNGQQADGFLDVDVRRAFAWLLLATRQWYAAAAKPAPSGPPENWQLILENYRHPGRRTYHFDAESSFHVVHGYNGTGKSSFTEALELLLTGRIERLDVAAQGAYFPVVRYRSAQSSQAAETAPPEFDDVSAELKVGQTRLVRAAIARTPEPGKTDHVPLWNGSSAQSGLSSAASFRLDQPTMDSLARSSDAERATVFLRSFFPADRTLFDELESARAAAQSAYQKLHADVRDASQIPWMTQPIETWDADTAPALLPACLPVSMAQMEVLASVRKPVADAFAKVRQRPAAFAAFEAALKELDAALDGLPDADTMLRQLDVALSVFHEFNGWTASTQVHRGDSFKSALNAWLELRAMADLAAKHYEVAATLAAAQHATWRPAANAATVFRTSVNPDTIATLRAERDDLVRARDQARAAVQRWGKPAADDADAATRKDTRARDALTLKETQSLNEVGAWLPCVSSDGTPVKLGDQVNAALKDSVTIGVGRVTVGVSGGLDEGIKQATELRQACQALASRESAAAMLDNCRAAAKTHAAMVASQERVERTFFSEIAAAAVNGNRLNEALNELLALFKPAPWAYADVSLQADHRGRGSQREKLGLLTAGDSKADLRLNTAELNSFTLALFLLCAPTLENPVRTLVLDDPMQNMDEMTVSAIARGLAKLLLIFPGGWQIVALFHGEDDLRRVRDEVACAVYRLPWLTPTPQTSEPDIRCDRDSTWKLPAQTLRELQRAPRAPASRSDVQPAGETGS